ncbi:MAG: hypothetical protein AAGF78_00160 [Pseudomonadota bacterium]
MAEFLANSAPTADEVSGLAFGFGNGAEPADAAEAWIGGVCAEAKALSTWGPSTAFSGSCILAVAKFCDRSFETGRSSGSLSERLGL